MQARTGAGAAAPSAPLPTPARSDVPAPSAPAVLAAKVEPPCDDKAVFWGRKHSILLQQSACDASRSVNCPTMIFTCSLL